MKTSIHPKYYQANVTCACGNKFTVGSTKPDITVDLCAKCHPFFTGEVRFVDSVGRVQKFINRQSASTTNTYVSKKAKKAEKAKKADLEQKATPKSLKEMLDKVRA